MVARQIPESEIPEGCRFKSDSLQFLIFSHHFPLSRTAISLIAKVSTIIISVRILRAAYYVYGFAASKEV